MVLGKHVAGLEVPSGPPRGCCSREGFAEHFLSIGQHKHLLLLNMIDVAMDHSFIGTSG